MASKWNEPGVVEFGKTEQRVKDIMTPDVLYVGPDATLKEVAEIMRDIDAGSVPICDHGRLLGMITDRDIVVRAIAEGRDQGSTRAKDLMSSPMVYCFEDQSVDKAAHIMEDNQIRRLIVLSLDMRMVGILSLGDIAVKRASEVVSGEILEKVSEPTRGKVA
jgi:CBS domain-containing protein